MLTPMLLDLMGEAVADYVEARRRRDEAKAAMEACDRKLKEALQHYYGAVTGDCEEVVIT